MSEEFGPQASEPEAEPVDVDKIGVETEGPSGVGAVFGPFMQAIVAPAQCWEALKAKPMLAIWIVVWIAVFTTGLSIVNLDITNQVMVATAQTQMRAAGAEITPEMARQQTETMVIFGNIIAYTSGILTIVFLALTALVVWVLAAIMGGKGASFGNAFAVAAAAGTIKPLLNSIYVTVIMQMNPPEIRRPEDIAAMTPTLGLDLILSGPDTAPWLNAVFQRIDLFSIWWIAVLASGAAALLKLSKGQGIAIGVVIWLIGTLLAMLGALAQGLGG